MSTVETRSVAAAQHEFFHRLDRIHEDAFRLAAILIERRWLPREQPGTITMLSRTDSGTAAATRARTSRGETVLRVSPGCARETR